MKIKIVSSFHVFAPTKVAFTAGTVIDAGDIPAGQSAQDWVDKGLAEEIGGGAVAEEIDISV